VADELEIIRCADAAEWDAWLAEHHGRTEGVWLDIAKLRSGVPSVTSDEAVDVGLCWGWISGIIGPEGFLESRANAWPSHQASSTHSPPSLLNDDLRHSALSHRA